MITQKKLWLATRLMSILVWITEPKSWVLCSWALSIAILAVGAAWAALSNNPDNFARMGSAVVIVSLLTYFAPFEKIMKKMKEDAQGKFEEFANLVVSASISVNDQQGMSDGERRAVNAQGENFGREVSTFGLKVAKLDVAAAEVLLSRHALIIAVLGTVVWGFGDLVGF